MVYRQLDVNTNGPHGSRFDVIEAEWNSYLVIHQNQSN